MSGYDYNPGRDGIARTLMQTNNPQPGFLSPPPLPPTGMPQAPQQPGMSLPGVTPATGTPPTIASPGALPGAAAPGQLPQGQCPRMCSAGRCRNRVWAWVRSPPVRRRSHSRRGLIEVEA